MNYASQNIKLCHDGKYRWVYELDMYKNSAILRECYRVFLITCCIVAVIGFFIGLGDGFFGALKTALSAAVIVAGIFLVLGTLAYFILAFMYNGKYCVLFEMDEEGVLHAQQEKQVKKAQLLGAITALAGAAKGKIGTVGTGILAGTRTKMYSGFSAVKEVEALPAANLIRLNGALERNQVYVEAEDFDFVLNYIVAHCPEAKVIGECSH